jgi:hypothetical protein
VTAGRGCLGSLTCRRQTGPPVTRPFSFVPGGWFMDCDGYLGRALVDIGAIDSQSPGNLSTRPVLE